MKYPSLLLFYLGLVLSVQAQNISQVLYVNQAVQGGLRNGSSWSNAFPTLQEALTVASGTALYNEIWVANGVYRPSLPSGKNATFRLVSGVTIIGGFNGTESNKVQRDSLQPKTILSGDIGVSGLATDNVYHLVTYPLPRNAKQDTIKAGLNSLILESGQANGVYPQNVGGGMYVLHSNPNQPLVLSVSYCQFRQHSANFQGGALWLQTSNRAFCKLELTQCKFENNSAINGQGGVGYSAKFSGGDYELKMHGCVFNNNKAIHGGVWVSNGSGGNFPQPLDYQLWFTSCAFYNNTADNAAIALLNDTLSTTATQFTNCTFSKNRLTSTNLGNLFVDVRQPFNPTDFGLVTIRNCIFWGNQLVSTRRYFATNQLLGTNSILLEQSIIERAALAQSTFWYSTELAQWDRDPVFRNPNGNDFRLEAFSPAIDAGINYGQLARDAEGRPRIYNRKMDIGAFEFDGTTIRLGPPTAVGVYQADTKIYDAQGWTHFLHQPSRSLLFSIQTRDSLLIVTPTEVSIQVFQETGTGAKVNQQANYLKTDEKLFAVPRSWSVTSTIDLSKKSFPVRFYLSRQDSTDLVQTLAVVDIPVGTERWVAFKVNGKDAFVNNPSGYTTWKYQSPGNGWEWNFNNEQLGVEFTVNGFSSGSIGVIDVPQAPLSVDFLEIKAYKKLEKTYVEWKVANEYLTISYEVQRSNDGVLFEAIEEVAVLTPGSSEKIYAIEDKLPLPGWAYYRIQEKDANGAVQLSPIASLWSTPSKSFQVFPNPTKEELTLEWPLKSGSVYTLQLLDLQGKLVREWKGMADGTAVMTLYLEDVATGVYLLTVQSTHGVWNQRVMIGN